MSTQALARPQQFLAILDVGHGNCAVLVDTEGVIIIDAGPGSALLEFLTEQGITEVDVVLLSHADQDHIDGLIQLLAAQVVHLGHVRFNTDSEKGSTAWDDLVYELEKAQQAHELQFEPALTSGTREDFRRGDVAVDILGPSGYLAAKGPGSTDREGRTITSNSISAVVRLSKEGHAFALLPGDLDQVGLANMMESAVSPAASLLVFPHHGGKPGTADMGTFTRDICDAVSPRTVVFSIGRGKHATPRPEIVSTIRDRLPGVRIACTQLSMHCAEGLPTSAPTHLNRAFARGRERHQCCAGTLIIDLDNVHSIRPADTDHVAFIRNAAPTALCTAGS